jgi:heme A synthase
MTRFAKFSWSVLAINIAVIAWGAFVRASGSGAGCGSHWPLCKGEVMPRAPGVATVIELTHRVTSGFALVLVFAMAVWAWRAFPKGSAVRTSATWSAAFMAGEAAIGAGLVLFELVAHDASLKRATSMSLHLTNTFFLLAALVLTAFWASGREPRGIRLRAQGAVPWLLALPLLGMLVVGTSGAVAALGDTLWPARSLADGLAQDFSTGAHLFLRLRFVHPFIAGATAAALVVVAPIVRALRPDPAVRRASYAVTLLIVLQVGAGLLNLALLAPVWMQLVHLVIADLVWLALVLLAATALAREAFQASPSSSSSDAAASSGLASPRSAI